MQDHSNGRDHARQPEPPHFRDVCIPRALTVAILNRSLNPTEVTVWCVLRSLADPRTHIVLTDIPEVAAIVHSREWVVEKAVETLIRNQFLEINADGGYSVMGGAL